MKTKRSLSHILNNPDSTIMKLGMDIFCSSPASTAIRSGRLGHSRSTQTQTRLGQDSSCTSTTSSTSISPKLIHVFSTPCSSSSEPALNPKLVNKHDYMQLHKQKSGRKSTSSSTCFGDGDKLANNDKYLSLRRRSSVDVNDLLKAATVRQRSSSSRNFLLLDDKSYFDLLSNSGKACSPVVPANSGSDDQYVKLERKSSTKRHERPPPIVYKSSSNDQNGSPKLKSSTFSSSSLSCRSTDKVVVMYVSLHCKGCEAKIRKHISKMEGVKSFSIDLAAKRVTVISSMNPQDLLASVSKIKYAQFWPSSSSSVSSSPYPSCSSSSSPYASQLNLSRMYI